MEHNYVEDVKIDPENLDVEWIEHPSLVQYYNDEYAEAIAERDLAKLRLEYKTAQLDLKIRSKPHRYGFDGKPTESAIKNKVITNKAIRKQAKRLIKAQKALNVALAMKITFEHRKKALENIVSLRITGIHSDPKNIIKQLKEKGLQKNHKAQVKALNKKVVRGKARKHKKKGK